MKILLAIILLASSMFTAKADWFGDGNFNVFAGGAMMTNKMNILSNNITIACWLRIRDTGTGLEQKNVFFVKGALDFGANCQYMLRIFGSKLQFNYRDQVGGLHTYDSSSTFIWTNRLRFVAITYTFTNDTSMQMYMDGQPISGSWTSGNGKSNNLSSNQEFSISGPSAQLTGGGILMGEQGPVMAWITNLTYAEIQRLYTTRVHGLAYIIQPQLCVFNMTWDTMRYGFGQNATSGGQNPSRVTYAPYNLNNMPAFGGTLAKPLGNQLMSFIPNE
jgi:hypothetical protein